MLSTSITLAKPVKSGHAVDPVHTVTLSTLVMLSTSVTLAKPVKSGHAVDPGHTVTLSTLVMLSTSVTLAKPVKSGHAGHSGHVGHSGHLPWYASAAISCGRPAKSLTVTLVSRKRPPGCVTATETTHSAAWLATSERTSTKRTSGPPASPSVSEPGSHTQPLRHVAVAAPCPAPRAKPNETVTTSPRRSDASGL
eukprot:363276-Chlamydomonas_euryale.AAC.5